MQAKMKTEIEVEAKGKMTSWRQEDRQNPQNKLNQLQAETYNVS